MIATSTERRLKWLVIIPTPPHRPLSVRLRPYKVLRARIAELLRQYEPIGMPADSTWDTDAPERRQAEYVATGLDKSLPDTVRVWVSNRPQQVRQATSYKRWRSVFDGAYAPDDLVNDSMLKTWPNAPKLSGDTVEGYSAVALKRLAIDRGPKRRKVELVYLSEPEAERIPTGHESPDTHAARSELADRLYEFLWLLPARERDVLVMVGWGYSYTAISSELGVDKSTVQRRVNRARARLEPYRQLIA